MSNFLDFVPVGYEALTKREISDYSCEYIASYKADNTLVNLRIYSFAGTSDTNKSRHLRNYLRRDVGFIDELNHPNIIHLFDYSESKKHFWIATQPAKTEKLSESFSKLKSLTFEKRKDLVKQLLSTIEFIHFSKVVHQNLSSEGIFLGSACDLYVGDFGLASYLTDEHTSIHDTTSAITSGVTYLAPEIKDNPTSTADVRCDIFSAGLLTIEILFASPLPKEIHEDFYTNMQQHLEQQSVIKITNSATYNVLLKAIDPDREKRWSSIRDFSLALEMALDNKSVADTVSADISEAVVTTQPTKSSSEPTDTVSSETVESKKLSKSASESERHVTPPEAENEIWNDRYEIIEKIGGGGQAIVYKAFDRLTNEEIAIKTLLARHRKDKSAINRLKQEAMVARSLTHSYIIKTYSVEQRTDEARGGQAVFICMELIESGLELKDVIDKRRAAGDKFTIKEVLQIVRQLLDALKYAHEYTIHRDIKPGNIMLVPHDGKTEADISDLTQFDIRLMDFGIAKVLTRKRIEVTGKGFWSAHYGAPELADSKSTVDVRADLYSVGVIMYQMFTGNIPRKGSPSVNKVNKEVAAELAKVIDKSINTDREKRFKSAAVFMREIEAAVSRFSWIRKTAKVAAIVMLVSISAAIVKMLIPTSERLLVDESITLLEGRNPERQISDSADIIIKFSDLEDYDIYDALRQEALVNLNTLKKAENRDFTSRFPPWKNQESAWLEIEPLIRKTADIQNNRQGYNARKDLPVVSSLMQLEPSSSIISKVQEDIRVAEDLFARRPLSESIINTCYEAYYSAVQVYTNIEKLADDPQSPQDAETINDMLKNVQQLRGRFLSARSQLDDIEQLDNEDFQKWSAFCLEKGDKHYNSLELDNAEQSFSLLNQICGTLSVVKDQLDFEGSDMSLIVSRLMQLCYENIETFENYPEWREKLRKVYEKRELLAQYNLWQQIISKGPMGVPEKIYTLLDDTISLQEQGKTKDAKDKLEKVSKEYTAFLNNKIDDLELDCSRLLAISSVAKEGIIDIQSINNNKNRLEQLRQDVAALNRLEERHIEEFNKLSKSISAEKNLVKEHLSDKASGLRKQIVQKVVSAKQDEYFWDSKLITKYIYIASQYDSDDIAESINNWPNVENIDRLPEPVMEMEKVNSRLDIMLTRKKNLDELAMQIDEGVAFCEKFRGASIEERENQQRWLSGLKRLREQLAEKQDGLSLVDQKQEVFDSLYEKINTEVEKILAEIPRNSNRIEQMIKQAEFLEAAGTNINQTLRQWRTIAPKDKVDGLTFKSITICEELQNIKADVDDWDENQFNRQMLSKCKYLTDILNHQHQTVQDISKAVKNLKKRLDSMMSNQDIIELNAFAMKNDKVHVINMLRNSLDKQAEILAEIDLQKTDEEIFSATLFSDFHVSTWLEQCNKARQQMEERIDQLKIIEETIPPEAALQLAGESPIERLYYDDLKNATISEINQQQNETADKIINIENDNQLMQMCDFLEKMEDGTLPTLNANKQTLASVSSNITKLKALELSDLKTANDFNNSRKEISAYIAALNKNLDRLNGPELQSACKETVSNAPAYFKKLMSQTPQTEKVRQISSLLWSFYSKHKDWTQWQNTFRELFHIDISENGSLRFASLPDLRPVDKNGKDILEGAVSLNPSDFLYIETGNAVDFGWPKYSNALKDPSVSLVFIPSGPDNPEPFYMAAYEINNAQYQLFLSKSGAKATLKPKGWSRFLDTQGKDLITSTSFDYPACSIKWDERTNTFSVAPEQADVPITWVTYYGAQSYARWLAAQLPTFAQHEYACRAGVSTPYPWGNDISQISEYAHVRAAGWQYAANEYNSKINNPLEIAHPPVGAIKDFQDNQDKTLDINKIIHTQNTYNTAWPISNAKMPNDWGLYDMIGNVWEWCQNDRDSNQPIICGGSCLSPPEYLRPDSRYEFQDRACDVGFRIIILAR